MKHNKKQPEQRTYFTVERIFRGNMVNPMGDVLKLTASLAATDAAHDDGEQILYVTTDTPTPGAATVTCKGNVEYVATPTIGEPEKPHIGTY